VNAVCNIYRPDGTRAVLGDKVTVAPGAIRPRAAASPASAKRPPPRRSARWEGRLDAVRRTRWAGRSGWRSRWLRCGAVDGELDHRARERTTTVPRSARRMLVCRRFVNLHRGTSLQPGPHAYASLLGRLLSRVARPVARGGRGRVHDGDDHRQQGGDGARSGNGEPPVEPTAYADAHARADRSARRRSRHGPGRRRRRVRCPDRRARLNIVVEGDAADFNPDRPFGIEPSPIPRARSCTTSSSPPAARR